MSIITLTTDFGLTDGYVGAMKGVILTVAPAAQIVDLSHAVPPQAVPAGARLLRQACPHFPAGTVHLAVVDPGVGTSRRPLALRLGPWFFVGPDNGLFSPLLDLAGGNDREVEIVHLTEERFWLPRVSSTFHGRDIFAPVAAHLANGVPLAEFGYPVTDLQPLAVSQPVRTPSGWTAHVVAIDAFGNLETDLAAADLPEGVDIVLRIAGNEIRGVQAAYGMAPPGTLIALVDSSGFLEVALVNGSAANRTKAVCGDPLEVVLL